jgi:hypothetical protein
MGTDAEGRLYVCGLTTQTVYLLDSPDLGPAPTGLGAGALPHDAVRIRLEGKLGHRLDGKRIRMGSEEAGGKP